MYMFKMWIPKIYPKIIWELWKRYIYIYKKNSDQQFTCLFKIYMFALEIIFTFTSIMRENKLTMEILLNLCWMQMCCPMWTLRLPVCETCCLVLAPDSVQYWGRYLLMRCRQNIELCVYCNLKLSCFSKPVNRYLKWLTDGVYNIGLHID